MNINYIYFKNIGIKTNHINNTNMNNLHIQDYNIIAINNIINMNIIDTAPGHGISLFLILFLLIRQ